MPLPSGPRSLAVWRSRMARLAACSVADVTADKPHAVTVDEVEVALVKDGEDYYAIRDECSHAAIALSEGDVEGCFIECWLHGSAFDLLRAAYHLGNRHVALALQPDRLLLEPDHVLADMLRRMHLIVSDSTEAFEPDGGAYAADGGHGHGHDHGHGHGHGHGDAHDHGHDHGHGDGHPHGHGH